MAELDNSLPGYNSNAHSCTCLAGTLNKLLLWDSGSSYVICGRVSVTHCVLLGYYVTVVRLDHHQDIFKQGSSTFLIFPSFR